MYELHLTGNMSLTTDKGKGYTEIMRILMQRLRLHPLQPLPSIRYTPR